MIAAAEDDDSRFTLFCGFDAGLRRDEICEARRDWFDLKRGSLGSSRVMALGGCTAGVGLALVSLVPSWQAGLFGFVLVGESCSNIVPVLFTAVGRQETMPESVAVPAITTPGYLGMLAGPAAIGFMAHAVSLSAAFLVVAFLLFGVAASARVLRR